MITKLPKSERPREHDLSEVATWELCEELSERDGVEDLGFIEPYDTAELKIEGQASVFVIRD